MIRELKEFTNTGSQSGQQGDTSQGPQKTPLTLATSAGFTYDKNDSNDESGLVIARNGTIAVDYDLAKNTIFVRPDNNLALDTQGLQKFKDDLASCEQLAHSIASLSQK